jgi:hypothetical protein
MDVLNSISSASINGFIKDHYESKGEKVPNVLLDLRIEDNTRSPIKRKYKADVIKEISDKTGVNFLELLTKLMGYNKMKEKEKVDQATDTVEKSQVAESVMSREQEIELLRKIINEDYWSLNSLGDTEDGFETVSVKNGDDRRWMRCVTITTRSPSGRFFQWYYDKGLTENQENEFDENQKIIEVAEKKEIVEVVRYYEITEEDLIKQEVTEKIEAHVASLCSDLVTESCTMKFSVVVDNKYFVIFEADFIKECMTGTGADSVFEFNTTVKILSVQKIQGSICHIMGE